MVLVVVVSVMVCVADGSLNSYVRFGHFSREERIKFSYSTSFGPSFKNTNLSDEVISLWKSSRSPCLVIWSVGRLQGK